ncbi:Transposon Tf2-11 polyprotein [Bienertia sinuspersici]
MSSQSNGLAEAANKQILNSLQKRLEDKKGKWLFELHSTLWSLKTTQRESTWQTPFRLVYGTEALMPVKMGSTSLRVQMYHGAENDRVLVERLDLVEEVREQAALRMQAYLGKVVIHYNRQVEEVREQAALRMQAYLGKVVIHYNRRKARIHGKLSATCEGPYQIYDEVQPETYKMMDLEGVMLPNNWNADQLKKYFV